MDSKGINGRRIVRWVFIGCAVMLARYIIDGPMPTSTTPQTPHHLIEQFGERPHSSDWGKAYQEVRDYIELRAKDPDSIQFERCTEVRQTKQGWLVGCVFRGNNSFGGKTLDGGWYTIRYGQVVREEPLSAHKI